MLAGCTAGAINAPSLQRRPIEGIPIDPPETSAQEPSTATDPALAARLATLVADAEAAHRGFERERATTAMAIARGRGAAQGSEAWVQAQQAASALAAAQGPVREKLAEIDALRADPAYFGDGSRAAIDAAASRIMSTIDAEGAAVANLTPN